jgi:uncharacterized protein (TIGR02246 family)
LEVQVATIEDEKEIRGLYECQMDGWNQGDAAMFGDTFAEVMDFVAFDGSEFHSRQELVDFHERLFRTHLRGTRLVGTVISLRFLSPDVALLHAKGSTIAAKGTKPSSARDSIQTMVVTRTGSDWKITAFQNTRIRPIGRSFSGTVLWLVGERLWKLSLGRSQFEH